MSSRRGIAATDLADFLADAGTVVGGAIAIGAALGFLAGSLARDLGHDVDVRAWTETIAGFGGVAGLATLAGRYVGVS